MPTPIVVPSLGNVNRQLKVSLWLTRAGEQVVSGDRVVELLMPGVTFDVESPCTGTVIACECQPGVEVEAGTVLGWIEPADVDEPELGS
ncbi:branched-chain alpha-keto acid dehydrogenase subunit E2 [Gimesia alba]|uniref:Branched-chain alpha-keto acid dehydrogenase subunit E2 n=1 Tax=Gimesia alba TaxID=2527973 RepID=A0A517RJW8_9PLAN|nr:lipoyl domain-containing protein [Gimesia alba]QDT44173.1 branched-chain alpha-keto acid dehydrogenase subunit E2 [Gimesia alba]